MDTQNTHCDDPNCDCHDEQPSPDDFFVCDCPLCLSENASVGCWIDANDIEQGGLLVNFPIEQLEFKLSPSGALRASFTVDRLSGSLDEFVELITGAAAEVESARLIRSAMAN